MHEKQNNVGFSDNSLNQIKACSSDHWYWLNILGLLTNVFLLALIQQKTAHDYLGIKAWK